MKAPLYMRLAADGIRRNGILYVPYGIMGAIMVMTYQILVYLSNSTTLDYMTGGEYIKAILPLGKFVIAVFALLLLQYAGGYLDRKRMHEKGLYHVLGMGKRDLAGLLIFEHLMFAGAVLICGTLLGVALSKLAEVVLMRLTNMPFDYVLRIDIKAVVETILIFLVIFVFQLVILLIRVARSNPVSLLKSDKKGEKPPRGNLLLAIVGILLLGAAYYIAVTTKDPMSAIMLFFVAVIMVIVATYLLFITGSVTLCRLLKKNKSYYYKKNHFAAVSQMAYRMKRNGAGLASICILATMVLVMMSSSFSLYIGMEDILFQMYPHEIGVSLILDDISYCTPENRERMTELIVSECHEPKDLQAFYWCSIVGILQNGELNVDSTLLRSALLPDDFCIVEIIAPDDYQRMTGNSVSLYPGECLISQNSGITAGDTFSINKTDALTVVGSCETELKTGIQITSYFRTVTVVPYDFAAYVSTFDHFADYNGERMADIRFVCNFNIDGTSDEKIAVYERVTDKVRYAISYEYENTGAHGFSSDGRAASRSNFISTYGALLFLGILLSVVFLVGAVLIIYYKQISEGLEDRERFGIMCKVGMTDADIKKSINAQVLIVIIAPLIMAGIHLGFAFPIFWQLLKMFHLTNLLLVIGVTVGCYLLFCLFYAVVYKMTAHVYYRLVRR